MPDLWDAWVRSVTSGHAAVFRATKGRAQATVLGVRAVRMVCVGARSGTLRTVMLIAPLVEPDRIVLVASNMGSDESPAWYRNIVANPAVEIDTGGTSRVMRARVASADERELLWPDIVRAAPIYEHYQRRTPRELPVVLLEA